MRDSEAREFNNKQRIFQRFQRRIDTQVECRIIAPRAESSHFRSFGSTFKKMVYWAELDDFQL